jgi:branched-subunit amino acid transport protein
MDIRPEFLGLVLACALVTALPRVLPLVILSRVALPGWLLDWLRYVPIAVLAALAAIEVLLPGGRPWLSLSNPALPAIAAAFLLAATTRSLLSTVLAGVAAFWFLH